jgi:hypothetical protein
VLPNVLTTGPLTSGAAAPREAGPVQMLTVLRDSLYPSQREWAADQLASGDWRSRPEVVEALATAARQDPAPMVRAGCVRALAQIQVNTVPVRTAVQALKDDPDPRVRQEAEQALGALQAAPAPPEHSSVQPFAGY